MSINVCAFARNIVWAQLPYPATRRNIQLHINKKMDNLSVRLSEPLSLPHPIRNFGLRKLVRHEHFSPTRTRRVGVRKIYDSVLVAETRENGVIKFRAGRRDSGKLGSVAQKGISCGTRHIWWYRRIQQIFAVLNPFPHSSARRLGKLIFGVWITCWIVAAHCFRNWKRSEDDTYPPLLFSASLFILNPISVPFGSPTLSFFVSH